MDELWPDVAAPVIGMVHLRALPGSPRYGGDLAAVRDAALRDAEALAAGGVHALMIENFGDAPFYRGRVPVETAAHVTAMAAEVRRAVDVPVGVNVLRNDGRAALAAAHAAGAQFIRVNVLAGAYVTDQGLIEGDAAELMRLRSRLGAEQIKVLADVRVKHGAPVVDRPVEDEATDLVQRALADGLIVTGPRTGEAVDVDRLQRVKAAAGASPVWVGSGVTAQNVGGVVAHADGLIVGSHFKRGGQVDQPVEVDRVKRFMGMLDERGLADGSARRRQHVRG